MENFMLDDTYLIGDYLLDAQHKAILSYMAKVYASLLAGKKENEVFEHVDELDAYCKLHFLDEEKMMDEMSFPELSDHKAQHVLFLTHLESFMGKFDQQNITRNVDEFLFLKRWFLEHIEEFDREYAGFNKRAK
ncbi:MAG TPA: hemerythrin family protein [Geobacteraceae bacterium]|nr:hemerythrin family protein [Geobacteraceae bacterium]